jgi:hypothetical protein
MKRQGMLMAPQTALVACGLYCDQVLATVDGDPRGFCLVSWRDGKADYTSNTGPADRPKLAEALRSIAARLDPAGAG